MKDLVKVVIESINQNNSNRFKNYQKILNEKRVDILARKGEKVLTSSVYVIPPWCYGLFNEDLLLKKFNDEEELGSDKYTSILEKIPDFMNIMKERYKYILMDNPIISYYVSFNVDYESKVIQGQSLITVAFSLGVNFILLLSLESHQRANGGPYKDVVSDLNIVHIVVLLFLIANNILFSRILKLTLLRCK